MKNEKERREGRRMYHSNLRAFVHAFPSTWNVFPPDLPELTPPYHSDLNSTVTSSGRLTLTSLSPSKTSLSHPTSLSGTDYFLHCIYSYLYLCFYFCLLTCLLSVLPARVGLSTFVLSCSLCPHCLQWCLGLGRCSK